MPIWANLDSSRGDVLRRLAAVVACLVLATVTACTGSMEIDPGPSSPPPEPRPAAQAKLPESGSTLVPSTDPTALALAASDMLFEVARVVVLAPVADEAALARASSIAIALGVPVLPTGADDQAVGEEILRLSATTLLPVGDVDLDSYDLTSMNVQPVPDDAAAVAELLDVEVSDAGADLPADVPALAALEQGQMMAGPAGAPSAAGHMPETLPSERVEGVRVLADGNQSQLAAVGTSRAAGATVTVLDGDPRASVDLFDHGEPTDAIVGLGTGFGDSETFTWQAETALTGVQLPGGGQFAFDRTRYVALYGSPVTASLGVLGEQGTAATVDRAADLAGRYQQLTDDVVVPTLEVIVTVASGTAGSDGNYSNEWPAEEFVPLIEAAHEAGQYVVLDFQSGRTNFLDQVREYADLLAYPHVGIALDPEWRLGPDERPLEQIGSVGIDEVNAVIEYVADFVRENRLPQKIVMVHQFRTDMVRNREDMDTSRSEVAIVLHADGHGTPEQKDATWRNVREDAPDGVYWGWKNFYDEDDPTLTSRETYEIDPVPDFVSYQ
ncbi:hypothetical protein [Ruania halotolerans]|uniref:hypothetical protein n=1 Tax=Ruania halotolerans TaxID=2897773 RepID=UPI001E3D7861|nr:hypothetical protein [Ruania halotolerans]UFU04971.1 hypothetical protein LQF10_10815 [Ruania halotolerans]